MKVAVCLVVKNEAIEIIYWIAWYKALGFDSFIIYNDCSSDKTENVILSLKNVVDIRYMRNAENYDRSVIRQIRAYNDAVHRYKNEFDWIALFDADEYLDLYGLDVKEYLGKMGGNVSCVAFNWCCSGTNGFVNRPEGAPFLKYVKHGSNTLFWNCHTKVMFRPNTLKKEIYQVHNVIVDGDCVAADGEPIQWVQVNEHGGLTHNQPTWVGGRLLHYQSRSLEHYVKRHLNLEEIRYNLSDPLHVIANSKEYNEIESNLNRNSIQKYYQVMHKFIACQTQFIIEKLFTVSSDFTNLLQHQLCQNSVDIFDPVYTPYQHELENRWISSQKKKGNLFKDFENQEIFIFNIIDFFNKKLGIKDENLMAGEAITSDVIGIYIKGSNYIHLLSSTNDYFYISSDARISKVYTYEVWCNNDDGFLLSHPRNKRCMGSNPVGSISVNKKMGLNWETFTHQLISQSDIPVHILEAAQFLSRVKSIELLKCDYVLNGNSKYNELYLNIINSLQQNEFDAINTISGNIINEHLH